MAGGDGSLAVVAEAALERDLPFACIPFGTRNHFARDLGLDRDDPIGALDALVDGREIRIDVGRANDRLFLNNVSLGVYARLVHRREHHRRRSDAFARLRALGTLATHRHSIGITVDGEPIEARVVLVSNNAYASTCSPSASASGSTRVGCTSTRRRACCARTGTSGTASRSRSTLAPAGCTPRSTASRRSSRPRSSFASSRARYACSSRVAQLRSTSSWPGKAISAGSSSRANQRSSSTSSAATGSPSPRTIHVTEKT